MAFNFVCNNGSAPAFQPDMGPQASQCHRDVVWGGVTQGATGFYVGQGVGGLVGGPVGAAAGAVAMGAVGGSHGVTVSCTNFPLLRSVVSKYMCTHTLARIWLTVADSSRQNLAPPSHLIQSAFSNSSSCQAAYCPAK